MTFRSSVLLVAGEPIAVAPLLADYARDERAAVHDLTQVIRRKLDEVVLQAESRELLDGVALVAVWTASDGDALDPVARNRRARRLADAYQRMSASDPARVDRIARRARDYARMLRRMGVRDPWSLELEPVRLTTFLWALVRLIVLLPFADIGAVLGWVPYRLAGLVAERNAESDDVLGTVKLLSGILFVGGAWIVESIVVGVLCGAVWIVPFFALAAVTGYVALRYGELASGVMEWARALWLRAFHGDTHWPADRAPPAARRRSGGCIGRRALSSRRAGIVALTLFFAAGALIAGVTCIALLTPGERWNAMWSLKPSTRDDLAAMGAFGPLVMASVSCACALAAAGLWRGAEWGRRLAIAILVANLAGDSMNAIVRHDLRTLIGLPIGGLMIWYLMRADVRDSFSKQ